jgi:hypothetical protein
MQGGHFFLYIYLVYHRRVTEAKEMEGIGQSSIYLPTHACLLHRGMLPNSFESIQTDSTAEKLVPGSDS